MSSKEREREKKVSAIVIDVGKKREKQNTVSPTPRHVVDNLAFAYCCSIVNPTRGCNS